MRQAQLDIDTITDQISEAFFALDSEWRFVYLNTLAAELLRRDRSDLVGKHVWDEFSAALGTQFEEQYRTALAEREIVQFEEYYAPLRTWFQVRAYPSENGLNVYFQNISTTKSLEKEVEQKKYLLVRAEEIAEIHTWEWDIQRGKVIWSDGRVSEGKHSGFSGSIDTFLERTVYPEDRDLVRHAFDSALTGQPCDIVYRLVQPDGSVRVRHTRGAVFFDDEGHPVKMVGVAQDVTKRIEEAKRLTESEQRYRSLVESSLNAIAVNDGVRWMYMNRSGLEMFGASRTEDVVGQPIYAFLHPDHHELCRARSRMVIEDKKALDLTELKWHTLTGEVVDTEVLAMPVTFDEQTAVQLIIRDVSSKKRTEKMLIQSEKLAAIGQLAAGVAHEVRNPLTSLKGFLQLLRSDSDKRNQQYIKVMEQELNRIEMISNEMLMLAKPQAMSFQEHDVKEIISSVVTLLEPQAIMNNIYIAAHYRDVSPIKCVDNSVKQVFVNLIKNAIEAMPNGGQLTVEVSESNEQVCILVEDEGHGIPSELLARLGEPFLTTKDAGTGLGLMITLKIVEDHGGTITFNNKNGGGTSVLVTFPTAL